MLINVHTLHVCIQYTVMVLKMSTPFLIKVFKISWAKEVVEFSRSARY